MKIAKVLTGIVVICLLSALSVLAYEEPYKMGRGRYLNETEKKALFQDIEVNGSEDFRTAFHQGLDTVSKWAEGVKKPVKTEVIEFIRLEEIAGGPLAKGEVAYLISFNGREGISRDQYLLRQKSREKYYDIWVISGYFVEITKDTASGKYSLGGYGAAE